jgi:hypothetical protein
LRTEVFDDDIVTCPTCNKKYKVAFRSVHFPGAGSQADWLNILLPCKHESTEVYDDNRQQVKSVTEIAQINSKRKITHLWPLWNEK